MFYYTFEQNNGNHQLKGEKYIIIYAESAIEANNIALLNGIYFNGTNLVNGCMPEWDCRICGDRWKQVKDSDGKSLPKIHGMNPESLRLCKDSSWVIIKKDNTKYYTKKAMGQ